MLSEEIDKLSQEKQNLEIDLANLR